MLRTAVIGVGLMGRNHVRIYSKLPEANLIAVADLDEKSKVIAEKYNCKYYKNYNELLKKEKLDIVSVCVPTSLHYKVAIDVIDHGINLLIEKPITKSVEEAKKLIRLAKNKRVKLAVGHIERFNPAIQKLKQIIDQGKLGKITSLLARRVGLFPPRIKDMNVIIDLAVHDVDIFNYLLDKEPKQVFGAAGKALINEREDYADIFLKYDGTNGLIEVNWITPVKIRILNVTGTKGYANLNYITQDLVLYESNYKKSYDEFGDFVVNFGEPKKIKVKVKKGEPLKLELKSFINRVEANEEPLVTGEDGLRVLKIALQTIKSCR